MLGDFAGPIGTVILLVLAGLVLVKSSKIELAADLSSATFLKRGSAR